MAAGYSAADFILKPGTRHSSELDAITQDLIRKVHATRHLRMDKVRKRITGAPVLFPNPALPGSRPPGIVAIGASTGGPATVTQILGAFPEAPPFAFVLSQHMPPAFTRSFAERIDRLTALDAREAESGMELREGAVLVAPGGRHLEFESLDGRVLTRVVERRQGDKYAPSVDRMFESAAKQFGSDLVAVVLTGMGDDGRLGVQAVKAAGGTVVAESEETAVIFGMPRQAVRTGVVDAVLPHGEIAAAILAGVGSGRESCVEAAAR